MVEVRSFCIIICHVDVGDCSVDHEAKLVLKSSCSLLYCSVDQFSYLIAGAALQVSGSSFLYQGEPQY